MRRIGGRGEREAGPHAILLQIHDRADQVAPAIRAECRSTARRCDALSCPWKAPLRFLSARSGHFHVECRRDDSAQPSTS
eukprot:110107-Alexandrium_andersonii.AAC.1